MDKVTTITPYVNTVICQRTCYAIYRSTILVMAMMNMTKIIKLILMDESKNVVPSYINKIKGKNTLDDAIVLARI